jgi:hypothetical protein
LDRARPGERVAQAVAERVEMAGDVMRESREPAAQGREVAAEGGEEGAPGGQGLAPRRRR